jgi:L-fuconolactonase
MPIVDSHVHVWTHDPNYPWAAGERDLPTFNAHPDELVALLKANGVEKTVLVQYIQYRWDNRYTADVIKAYPAVFTGVCRVNPEDPASPDHLSYWTEQHGFRGVRLGMLPAGQDNWFTPRLMLPLFERAAALGVPIILLTKASRLDDIAAIVERVPGVTVVIDHLADCLGQPVEVLDPLLRLARLPNIYLKLGHIAENSTEGFPWRDTHAALEKIFLCFGAQRIMWGSDWPFTLKRMRYEQSLALIQTGLQFLTRADCEWVLAKTALRVWPNLQ